MSVSYNKVIDLEGKDKKKKERKVCRIMVLQIARDMSKRSLVLGSALLARV